MCMCCLTVCECESVCLCGGGGGGEGCVGVKNNSRTFVKETKGAGRERKGREINV